MCLLFMNLDLWFWYFYRFHFYKPIVYSWTLPHLYVGQSIFHYRVFGSILFLLSYFRSKILLANNVDSDQTPLWRLILVCSFCLRPFYGFPGINGVTMFPFPNLLVHKPSEADSIKSKISSKTSHGEKDSAKRHHHRHHQRQPGEQQFPIHISCT